MTPRFLTLLMCAALAGPLAAQDEEPAAPSPPEPAAPSPAAAPSQEVAPAAPVRKAGGLQLVPNSVIQDSATIIPDIEAHRIEPLSYVRRQEDVVRLKMGDLDIEADPVLKVGARPVSRTAWRRRALMYTAANEVERRISTVLAQQELRVRAAAGVDVTGMRVDDEAVDRKLEEMLELQRQQARQSVAAAAQAEGGADEEAIAKAANAAVEAFLESVERSIGMDAFRELLRADASFEQVFLPYPSEAVEGEVYEFSEGPPPADMPSPAWMPQVSWDAMGADDSGRQLRVFLMNSAIQGGPLHPMFKPHIVETIRSGLIRDRGVAFFFDVAPEVWEADLAELAQLIEEGSSDDRALVWRDKLASLGYDPAKVRPDELFMQVSGEFVMVDELWYLVAGRLSDSDIDLITRELLTLEGMQQALQTAGRWLDDETYRTEFAAHEQEYQGTLFPLRQIIMFRGYTSIPRYREHYRYRRAYSLWREDTLTDEELLDHYQGGGRLFFERGTAVTDMAFAPLGSRAFVDESFELVQAEMEAVSAEHGDDWGALVERFPAPLAAASGRERLAQRSMQRNPLRMRMAESDLSIFLTGYSFADEAYYLSVPGEILGPWAQRCRRHAWGAETNAGVWMLRVEQFRRSRPLAPFEGANYQMVKEDFLDLNYLFWSQESLAALLDSVQRPG